LGECAGARDVPGGGKGDEAKEGKGELEGKRESVTKEEVEKKEKLGSFSFFLSFFLSFFFLSFFLSFFLLRDRRVTRRRRRGSTPNRASLLSSAALLRLLERESPIASEPPRCLSFSLFSLSLSSRPRRRRKPRELLPPLLQKRKRPASVQQHQLMRGNKKTSAKPLCLQRKSKAPRSLFFQNLERGDLLRSRKKTQQLLFPSPTKEVDPRPYSISSIRKSDRESVSDD
jgi:hypothetical protein